MEKQDKRADAILLKDFGSEILTKTKMSCRKIGKITIRKVENGELNAFTKQIRNYQNQKRSIDFSFQILLRD